MPPVSVLSLREAADYAYAPGRLDSPVGLVYAKKDSPPPIPSTASTG